MSEGRRQRSDDRGQGREFWILDCGFWNEKMGWQATDIGGQMSEIIRRRSLRLTCTPEAGKIQVKG